MSKFGGIPVESANPQGQGGSRFGGVPAQAAPTQPQPQAPQPQQDRFSVGNVVGSALTGFNDLIAGLPGDVMDASGFIARNTVAPAIDYVAGTNYADQIAAAPSVGQAMREDVGQIIPRTLPESRAARYGQAAGRGVASALVTGTGGMLAQGARGVAGTVGQFLAPQTARELAVITGAGAGSGVGAKAGRAVGQEVGGNTGAALGELVGGIGGGIAAGAGVDRAVGAAMRPAKPPAPSVQQLRAEADMAYKEAKNAGVIIRGPSVANLRQDIQNELADFGFHPNLQPGVKVVLDELDLAAQNNVTLNGVEAIRRLANLAAKSGTNPGQSELVRRLVEKIDDFVENVGPQDIISGNSKFAVDALKKARGLWSRVRKTETLDEALLRAEDRAASTYGGGNEDNTIRQNLRQILDSPRKSRGFSKAELAAIRAVVRGGGPVQSTLRKLGKFSPLNNGFAGSLGNISTLGGATMGQPYLAIPSAVGLVSKPIADAMTTRGFNRLSEMMRSGSGSAPRVPISTPTAIPKAAANSVLSQYAPRITNQMGQAFAGGDTLDRMAMAAGPIPVVGDAAGVANDVRNFASGKTPMTWANLGLAAAGALPFVPGVVSMAGKGAAKAADAGGRVFYRGTKTGSTERIAEPFSEAKGLTFMANKPESARTYGDQIEEIVAKPGAKILDDTSPEFWRLIGRKRPPNGFVGSARGGVIAVVNDAIKKARAAGYDAISFSNDADIGSVILNEGAFVRGAQASPKKR